MFLILYIPIYTQTQISAVTWQTVRKDIVAEVFD